MKRKLTIAILSVYLLAAWLLVSAAQAEVRRETVPLERNGIALHLERYYEEDGSSRNPVLFVHGVTYSSHEFDVDYGDYSLARFFAKKGFEVWLLDVAGFGSSGAVADGFLPDSDYASEDIASAVRCILARHDLPSMDVMGWSWGTVTSGRFAARHPEMVRRLVLYAPIVAGLGESEVPEPFHVNSWDHAAGDFQVTARGEIDYDMVEKAAADTFLSNAWRYDKVSSPNGGRRDLLVSPSARLIPTEELRCPVLIIAGDRDPYVSPELCREAFQTLTNPESRIFIRPGAAHSMLMERPHYKIFREKILAFLTEEEEGR